MDVYIIYITVEKYLYSLIRVVIYGTNMSICMLFPFL